HRRMTGRAGRPQARRGRGAGALRPRAGTGGGLGTLLLLPTADEGDVLVVGYEHGVRLVVLLDHDALEVLRLLDQLGRLRAELRDGGHGLDAFRGVHGAGGDGVVGNVTERRGPPVWWETACSITLKKLHRIVVPNNRRGRVRACGAKFTGGPPVLTRTHSLSQYSVCP